MADTDARPRRLVAGAIGPERWPFRKDPDEPRWFEPLHVRAPGRARDDLAGLVAAGADVLLAPTWLTHRRALLPVGETRRAAAWTAAAVRVAREAVDRGLELRERAAEAAAESEERRHDAEARGGSTGSGVLAESAGLPAVPRLPVLVAGVLPALDAAPEPGSGRLGPRDAALERDARTQAGLLAEAAVDLVLVEGGGSVAATRVALDAVTETGLGAWVVQPVSGSPVAALPSGESVEAWAASIVHGGASVLLLSPVPATALEEALARVVASGVTPDQVGVLPFRATADGLETAATRWVEDGAWHLGLGDGASADRIGALRGVLDRIDGERLAREAAARSRWDGWVREAARRAPAGRAAWITPMSNPAPTAQPAGFAWSVVPAGAVGALPVGELRLLVAEVAPDPERLAALLEPGGVLLARDLDPGQVVAAGLRILEIAEEPPLVLARRDP